MFVFPASKPQLLFFLMPPPCLSWRVVANTRTKWLMFIHLKSKLAFFFSNPVLSPSDSPPVICRSEESLLLSGCGCCYLWQTCSAIHTIWRKRTKVFLTEHCRVNAYKPPTWPRGRALASWTHFPRTPYGFLEKNKQNKSRYLQMLFDLGLFTDQWALIGAVSLHALPAHPFWCWDNNNIMELDSSYSYVTVIPPFLLLSLQINEGEMPFGFIFHL